MYDYTDKKISNCPMCNSSNVYLGDTNVGYFIKCCNCNNETHACSSVDFLVNAWNELYKLSCDLKGDVFKGVSI